MRIDEAERIRALLRHPRTPLPAGALGPGDDAAVLPPMDGRSVVASTDLVAEGIHFLADADPHRIGHFAAAVTLSDLAAMGATPVGLLVAYGVPRTRDAAWLDAVGAGVAACLDAHDCPLLGGDTKEAASAVVVGTAMGSVPEGQAVTRSGARPGDLLVLSGPIGGPGAALSAHGSGRMDTDAAMAVVLGRTPRIAAGKRLRELGAHALVDLSDGLARAARLVAEASQVAVRLDADRLPLDPLAAAALPSDGWAEDAAERARVLGFGGEYELLAAVPPRSADAALDALRETGCRPAVVGRCDKGEGVTLQQAGKSTPLPEKGWRHFS